MLVLLLAAQSAPPGAVTAEQAIEAQAEEVGTTTGLKCPRGGEGEEIVVCGRRRGEGPPGSEFRIPYVAERGRRIPGEPTFDGGGCMRLCPQPVTIPVLKIPGFIGKIVERLKDDE